VELPNDIRSGLRSIEAAADPLDAVVASRALRQALDGWERDLVAEASAAGRSWDAVGRALGLSRQAAWERYRQAAPKPARRLEGARQRQKAQLAEARRLRADARAATTDDARKALLHRADELRARALAALDDNDEHETKRHETNRHETNRTENR
jgi:hypothetical protein